jgi:hypothetical protein
MDGLTQERPELRNLRGGPKGSRLPVESANCSVASLAPRYY